MDIFLDCVGEKGILPLAADALFQAEKRYGEDENERTDILSFLSFFFEVKPACYECYDDICLGRGTDDPRAGFCSCGLVLSHDEEGNARVNDNSCEQADQEYPGAVEALNFVKADLKQGFVGVFLLLHVEVECADDEADKCAADGFEDECVEKREFGHGDEEVFGAVRSEGYDYAGYPEHFYGFGEFCVTVFES